MSNLLRSTVIACIATAPFAAHADISADQVAPSGLVSDSVSVDWTLTDCSAATCLEITVKYEPDDLEVGPFCPTIIDGEGGI